mgnify:CR=1 FL=1
MVWTRNFIGDYVHGSWTIKRLKKGFVLLRHGKDFHDPSGNPVRGTMTRLKGVVASVEEVEALAAQCAAAPPIVQPHQHQPTPTPTPEREPGCVCDVIAVGRTCKVHGRKLRGGVQNVGRHLVAW